MNAPVSNSTPGDSRPGPSGHDPYAALRVANFRHYFIGNYLSACGLQMQTTAVGWDIFQRTQSELALGYVGLVQFLPMILLWIVSGHVADRFNRRWIVTITVVAVACASMGLAVISFGRLDHRWMYVCLAVVGVARAFQTPAKASMLPQLVPIELFTNAVTWNSSGFQLASVLGPALAGGLIAVVESPAIVYLLDAAAAITFACLLLLLRPRPQEIHTSRSWRDLVGGLSFMRAQPLVLGAITLDMFAVLFGGAVAMLPVYADQILAQGAFGLGCLQAAPAIGALAMALFLAHRPPLRRAGLALLWSVVGFGLATIVFGVSRWFSASLLMLFLTGAFDNVSVVIRSTLVQTQTPDSLRGRVSAINSLFIGASNELGRFESGLVAHWFGPVFSVVSGGVGSVAVVGLIGLLNPRLRNYRTDREELPSGSADPGP